MKKRLLSLLLVLAVVFSFSLSAFATDTGIDIIDDPLSYYFENQMLGVQKGTGVTLVCPKCDYKVAYTGGTLVTCPHDGEALVLSDLAGVHAEKAPSGIGRKDLPGYQDNKGTPSINYQGQLIVVPEFNYYRIYSYNSSTRFAVGNYTGSVSDKKYYDVVTDITSEHCNILAYTSSSYTSTCLEISYKVIAPVNGYYTVPEQSIGYNDVQDNYLEKMYSMQRKISCGRKYYSKGQTITLSVSGDAGGNFNRGYSEVLAYFIYPKIICEPIETTVNQYNKFSNNNNIWNGNIYTDNSTNLTYIYPQYTTVNEKNETVTNISNTPIIYNNETKKYYAYDNVTNNYYYISYEPQATPTPSPSPTPAPTDKPGGSISTPETGKPGGDTGDTTGILAVLVEIRDNMIQGFLDIKAAFVAGFAELSSNFTLAIENLNVNIQNIFNKKFPDQSTPETALPSPTPSPSPAPLDPILPETQNLIIPKMNSNTFTDEHGTWVASGSSKYSDVFDFFHAFDRSTSDFWETNASPSYLQIEIPDPESYYIDGYIMRISKFNNRYAKEWTLQGSDDGNTWDDLDKQTGQNLSDLEEHKYPLTLRKAYKYYRLNMSNYASSMCSLSHFNLLGYDAKDVVTPTPSPGTPDVTPTPVPTDKPDGGNTTNNFWNIIFPNFSDDGTDSGHKGIFWALVSLILAIIAFFTNMLAGYKYLFPFLPDGVVMTINACVFVLFLFVVIKFIMRSK